MKELKLARPTHQGQISIVRKLDDGESFKVQVPELDEHIYAHFVVSGAYGKFITTKDLVWVIDELIDVNLVVEK
jgi:hypothetical protein